jgi:hypothetical protein
MSVFRVGGSFETRFFMVLLLTFFLLGPEKTQAGYPANSDSGLRQADYWELKDIDAFFKDPLMNFDKIKKLQDPKKQLSLYAQWNSDVILKFFRIHFQEIDERKIEILVYLLVHYRGYPVPEEAARIFNIQPVMFVKELEKTPEWMNIIDDISWSWESFSSGLTGLGASEFEKEAKEYALSLHEDREQKFKVIEAFVNDPVANFDRIKRLDDICWWFGTYERYFIKDGILSQSDNVLYRLFHGALVEIDEKKIEILIYMILHCDSPYHSEVLMDEATGIFGSNPQIFVRVLEKTSEWKRVVDRFIGLGETELFRELGDSEFEMKIKKYVFRERRRY